MPPQSLVRFLRAPASPAESDVRQHAGALPTLQKQHVNTRALTSIPRRQQRRPDTDLLRTHVNRVCHTNVISKPRILLEGFMSAWRNAIKQSGTMVAQRLNVLLIYFSQETDTLV